MPLDKNQEREDRIQNEIIVDCYDEYESAAGWHCYLEDKLAFSFKARCVNERTISPLKLDEVVEVMDMADQDDCLHEMFVIIRLINRQFAVPLVQLQPINADETTKEAVEDWHYCVEKNH